MDFINLIKPKVLIIGGGFAGLEVARGLKNSPYDVIMVDKHNYHTFQPLLYQVAIGVIEAESIGFPIRRIFSKQENFKFYLAEVQKICLEEKKVETSYGEIKYDFLVIASGSTTNFFGNKELERLCKPMKNISEAFGIRNTILKNLELLPFITDPSEKKALMTFVVVGGGPTGVELAGALGELRRLVLKKDYHDLNPDDMNIYLVEGKPVVLASMSAASSAKAKEFLQDLRVEVINGVHVKSYDGIELIIDKGISILTKNVFWAAGVKGEIPEGIPPENILKTGKIQTDEMNRIPSLTNVYAIGDAATAISTATPDGHPGVAQVAIQQGRNLAKNLIAANRGDRMTPFVYRDKGSLATIGRNKAVADIGKFKTQGFFAWLIWGIVHIMTLAGFLNRGIIFMNWIVNYITKNSSNRIIVSDVKKIAD
jgi:NADH dehydrogenase